MVGQLLRCCYIYVSQPQLATSQATATGIFSQRVCADGHLSVTRKDAARCRDHNSAAVSSALMTWIAPVCILDDMWVMYW